MTARIIARHLVNETGVTERDARAHRGVYGELHMIPELGHGDHALPWALGECLGRESKHYSTPFL